jgi:glutamyl-tRNA synthetase
MSALTVRFAPSPTGFLHVGNARVALVNWLFARAGGGRFLLRLDDTDKARCEDSYAIAIEEDMEWLGLGWDDVSRQSDHLKKYDKACAALREAGRLYPCYETPDELAFKRKSLLSRGQPPLYDRAALELSEAEREKLEDEGRRPHWRFKLGGGEVAWDDLVHGHLSFAGENLSDPVLVREDGSYLYMLPSTVDDAAMEVSHVVRGDDHLANSAVQIQLFEALDVSVPRFAHLPLLKDAEGGELSKRLGSLSLRDMRGDGIEAMAVNSLLASLGTSEAVKEHGSLEELVASFDFAKFSRNPPKFSYDELERLNGRILHLLPFDRVASRLAEMGLAEADTAFWMAVRSNLARLDEVREWWRVCHGEVTPVIEDGEFAAAAGTLLPEGYWDEASWGQWTKAVAEKTGRKGKELFKPLRLALTGCDHGPEMKALLPLMGRERVAARLRGETA